MHPDCFSAAIAQEISPAAPPTTVDIRAKVDIRARIEHGFQSPDVNPRRGPSGPSSP
jgi:hypothetical protein